MKKFLAEFKDFVSKGNVIDLAVGVIIGNAIKDIVTSLVKDIFTPILGIFTGRVDISTLTFSIKSSLTGATPININYGDFLESIINFLITALCIFIMIKMISKLHTITIAKVLNNSKDSKVEEVPAPKTEDLLVEIRDLLKLQTEQKSTSDLPENLD